MYTCLYVLCMPSLPLFAYTRFEQFYLPTGYKQRKNAERAQRKQVKRTQLALHPLFICLVFMFVYVCVSACLIIMLNTLLVIVLRRHQGQAGAVARATFTHVSRMQTTNVRPKQTKRFVCRLFILLSGQLLKHSCSIQHLFVRSHSVGSFVPPSVSQLPRACSELLNLAKASGQKFTQQCFFRTHVLRLPISICVLIWPWFGFNFISILWQYLIGYACWSEICKQAEN